MSPIEQAINDTQSKTTELESLYRRYLFSSQEAGRRDAANLTTNPLSMQLNACVDTGQNAGVPLYRRAFFDADFIAANPERLQFLQRLRNLIDEHVRTSKCSPSSI